MQKKLSIIFFLCVATLFLYFPALTSNFSQDDFFHFKVSKTDGSLGGFLNLLNFHSFEERKIAFYRPISREIPFFVSYSLFGLNPIPLRILSFLLVFGNIYLTYLLMRRLFKNEAVGMMAAFFVGISNVNTASLYYLAGGIQTIAATFFILLCLVLFEGHKKLSFLAFLLALGSEEQAAILPALLSGMLFIKYTARVAFKKTLNTLWPHILIAISFALADYYLIGFSKAETQYHLSFSIKRLANTLSWYTGWALGLPEMLIDFVLPGLKIRDSIFRYWPYFYTPILFGFFACLGAITLMVRNAGKCGVFKNKAFWLLVLWFPLGLLPILFLPQHKSTHYLYPVLPAFWGAISCLVVSAKVKPAIVGLFVGGAVLLNTTSSFAGRELYWAASRNRLAEKMMRIVTSENRKLPPGSGIYFKNDPNYPFVAKDWGGTSKQAAFVLNNEDAFQLFYNDPTIRVFYEDLGGVPVGFPKDKLVTVVAKL